jgi:hypothetical protein
LIETECNQIRSNLRDWSKEIRVITEPRRENFGIARDRREPRPFRKMRTAIFDFHDIRIPRDHRENFPQFCRLLEKIHVPRMQSIESPEN